MEKTVAHPVRETIAADEARRIALAAQGFGDPRPSGRLDDRQVRRVVERVGVLQLDSVNIVCRSHYLPVFARLGPYPREVLDRMCWGDQRHELFEYWGHQASLLPMTTYPLVRWRMQAAERWDWARWSSTSQPPADWSTSLDPALHAAPWAVITGMTRLAKERPSLVDEVLALVAERGPVTAREASPDGRRRSAADPDPDPTTGRMWNWQDAKIALEWLFYMGKVTIAQRRHFERRYDLTERVIPAEIVAAPAPSREDGQRELIRIAARAQGIATEKQLRDYFHLPAAQATARVAELVAAGELAPVRVEGVAQQRYLWPEATLPPRVHARALLSPFDSLIWDRDRILRLFAFHYRIGIYTPAAQRTHGYYVLPFLLGDRLVARVDVKADRKQSALLVPAAHVEADGGEADVAAALADELRLLADWLELDRVLADSQGTSARCCPARSMLGRNDQSAARRHPRPVPASVSRLPDRRAQCDTWRRPAPLRRGAPERGVGRGRRGAPPRRPPAGDATGARWGEDAMDGADLFVRELADRGTRFVMTLSGNGTEPFYAACARAGMPLVDFRNEQAASFAADAAARLSGQVGVCAVSAAVGHANAMIGLVNAWFDGAPVLLFSGSSDHGRTDQGKFQDFDQVALAAPLCKYAKLVDRPERIPFHVAAAYAAATAGRPGPVHLTIPADVLAAEVAPPARRPSPESGGVRPRGAPDPALVAELAALLARAERPILVAGSGAFYAGAGAALEAFARATAVPVIVPIWDRGVVDRPIPQFLGVVGAASGGPALLPDADLVLLVGARLDYRVGYGEPPALAAGATLVRIDADPAELRQGGDPDLALQSDPATALAALTAAVAGEPGFAPKRAWLAEARRRRDEFRRPWSGPLAVDGPITGRRIVEAVRACLDDETILLIDGGNIGQWAHALADRYPSHWLTCGASGVVGWGVAGAIAARLLHPERPILLLSGDGALGFGLPEFETAVRHDAPFVCVLADDRAWGSVASGQLRRRRPEDLVACRLGPVRYDLVAEGLGALGIRVERPEELAPAIRRGLASGRPTLIDVVTALGGPGDA